MDCSTKFSIPIRNKSGTLRIPWSLSQACSHTINLLTRNRMFKWGVSSNGEVIKMRIEIVTVACCFFWQCRFFAMFSARVSKRAGDVCYRLMAPCHVRKYLRVVFLWVFVFRALHRQKCSFKTLLTDLRKEIAFQPINWTRLIIL